MQLLLFDIDGTLLDTGGVGRGALQEGLRRAFPAEAATREMPSLDLAGATDRGVTRFLFSEFEIPLNSANEQAFLEAYLGVLHERLRAEDPPPGTLLPGVTALLQALQRHPRTKTLSLLTGNTRGGAKAKTTRYGVHQFFDFDSGAYGCDHWDRNALGHVAIERASKRHGHAPSQFEVTVIGDTPKDIACGKAAGARTIAVATGGYSADELARHDPDHVLEDFTALADVVALLLGEIPEQ